MPKGYKRKKYNFFIKKELQGRLTWQYFLLTLFCLLLFCAIFAITSADSLSISYDGQRVQVGTIPVVLAQEILQNGWMFLLAASLIIVIVTLVLTHRIAGPIYHFETVTDNMCQRNLDQHIFLRQRDEAKELANSLNRFNATLSADIRNMLTASAAIQTAIQANNLQQIAEANQQLNEILTSYRLIKDRVNS